MLQPRHRPLLALAAASGLLGACGGSPLLQETIAGAPLSLWLAGASVTSLAVLERGVVDAAYSAVTGKDCSLVHIERRGEYCRTEPAAMPVAFCTRSLADVDCWTVAQPYGPQQPVAATPPQTGRVARRWSLSPF